MIKIEQVEKYRIINKLSGADIARIFGVSSQRYYNWVSRGSLPKEYFETAIRLVGSTENQINGNTIKLCPNVEEVALMINEGLIRGKLKLADIDTIKTFTLGLISKS